jgi:hypothetical protein
MGSDFPLQLMHPYSAQTAKNRPECSWAARNSLQDIPEFDTTNHVSFSFMRNKTMTGLALAVALLPGLGFAQTAVDLFNGKDLKGWIQRGGKATYAVEGNEIVGTSTLNTPNSFLCTEKTYGDFILEYDFKVDPKLNSGVQIRSECFDADKQVELGGKTFKFAAGRVHGYQVEIDPEPKKDRWWSAGIYDEGRRGWLYPGAGGGDAKAFTDQGRKIFKQGDWNHVRVEAIGDSLKTWLNGTPCAAIKDSVTARGFIALQVHSIGKEADKNGTQVRWRNLKITEVSAASASPTGAANTLTPEEKAAGWTLLWDGKTTEGWRSAKGDKFPTRGWSMKDGALSVQGNKGEESTGGGDIITIKRYANFELQVDFKLTPKANSGIKFFVQPAMSPIDKVTGKPTAVGSAIGTEFQILDDALHPDAKLGKNGNRTVGSLYDLIPAPANKVVTPMGEWNHARILAQGKHVEFWLNGQKTVTFERGSEEFRQIVAGSKYKNIPQFGEWADGHILLQDHGDQVFFRNIKIRELSAN